MAVGIVYSNVPNRQSMIIGCLRPYIKASASRLARLPPPHARAPIMSLLQAFHTNFTGYNLIAVCWGKKNIVNMGVAASIFAIVAFILNAGCFVSDLEQALHKNNDYVIDPILDILHLPKTKACRGFITMSFMFSNLWLVLLIRLWRFPC